MPFPRRMPLRGRRELSHVLVLLPIGLIVAVCVIDVLAPPDIHLGPLLVAAPAITAAFAGPRLTAAIGALAVAAQVAIGIARQVLFTGNLQAQIASLVVVSGLVVLFTVVRERNERRLTQSRSVATVAQQVLLRPLPARSGALEIASFYQAAEEEAEMGGDLFAAARTTSSTRLIIGDVRGKGLPAYSHAAHRQATLPRLAVHLDGAVRWDSSQWDNVPGAESGPEAVIGADPGSGSGLLSAAAPVPDPAPGTAPGPGPVLDTDETFATVALLDIPDRWHVLRLINCGHPPPLLLRGGRATPLFAERPALPIGLGGLAGAPDYEVETFPFEPGDLLLLYTDGVSEARDGRGTFYPLAERAGAWSESSPQQVLRRLRADLLAHTNGRLGDDAAAVAVRRLPGPPPAASGRFLGEGRGGRSDIAGMNSITL
ncbi:PP2C family protein-serine/threonine phosphatase [Streptomyces decoyicus]|uniref:PP2C family protein-serine/threonine phosphatase n=1 Tax=Streptomyces decoyicus TaxID=249567 RepID=UPI00363FDCC0